MNFKKILCFLAISSGFSGLLAADSKRPDMVIFLSDDHTLGDSSVYGSEEFPTPNMKRLAEAGLTFDQAFVASPTCAPSRAALLTGLVPPRNGAEPNHAKPDADIKKLPGYLQELGYEVVAFGKVAHYGQVTSYGFDHAEHFGYHEDVAIPEGIEWLRNRESDKPLCLFLGTNWPHVPWPKPSEDYPPKEVSIPKNHVDTPMTRRSRSRYYGAVATMDRELGMAYNTAREVLGEDVFFLHTSDHGAQWPFAKWSLYDEGIRTPLIAAWPGRIEAGQRTDAMVSWVDILPTLVDVAGGEKPEDLDGRSFLPVLKGEAESHREEIFTTHSGDGRFNIYPMRSVRTPQWKYIRNLHPEDDYSTHIDIVRGPDAGKFFTTWEEKAESDPSAAAIVQRYHQHPKEELYDLSEDPLELNNLADDPEYAEKLAEFSEKVDAWMKAKGDEGKTYGKPRLLSDPDRAEKR